MVDRTRDPAFPPMEAWSYKALRESGEPHRWAGTDMSDERIRALSLGVILSYTWGANNDTLALVGRDADPRSAVIDALHEWWGITSGEQVLATATNLHVGMHAPSYAVVHPLVMTVLESGDRHNAPDTLPSRHLDFLRTLARFQGSSDDAYTRDYELWLQAIRLGLTSNAPQPFPTTIVGWDLCRSAWILRAGYTAGYITEEQAWPNLLYGLKMARRYFGNWRQLGDSYLTGHAYWSSRDLADMQNETTRRRASMIRHWHMAASPWRRVTLHSADATH